MKSARSKFAIGDRVVMTRRGRRYLRFCMGRIASTTGVVVGYCYPPLSVRIRRDGHAIPEGYFMGFWKKQEGR